MIKDWTLVAALASILLGISTASVAEQITLDDGTAEAPYAYTLIADASPCLSPCEGFQPQLAINEFGIVAFVGCVERDPNMRCGVFAGNGGPLKLIAGLRANPGLGRIENGPFSWVAAPSINARGTVAFFGCLGSFPDARCGVFTGAGGPISTIVDEVSGPFSRIDGFTGAGIGISLDGTVAFVGCLRTGPCGIFKARNGEFTLAEEAAGRFSMNARGTVAFERCEADGCRVFTSRRGDTDIVAKINPLPFGASLPTAIPAIDARDTVAFLSCLAPNCATGWGIYTSRADRPIRLVVDTDAFGSLIIAPSISADGTVAFFGCPAGRNSCGMYVIDTDDSADAVILLGHACCFGPPFEFPLYNQDINSFGQVAFAGNLPDGRGGIVRANPRRWRR